MKMDLRILISLISICLVAENQAIPDELRLHDALLGSYHRSVKEGGSRPVAQNSDVLNVQITYNHVEIWAMDEDNQHLTIKGYVFLSWQDNNLQWDASEFAGINSTRICSDDIWTPDICNYNGVMDQSGALVLVNTTGHVTFVPPTTLQLPCNKVEEQYVCQIRIGSWTFSDNLVHISAPSDEVTGSEGVNLQHMALSPGWEVDGVVGRVDHTVYECCPEPYSSLFLEFTVQRRECCSEEES